MTFRCRGRAEKFLAETENFACGTGIAVENSASILSRGLVTLAFSVLITAASPIFFPQKYQDAEDDFRPLRLGVSAVSALGAIGTQF